MKKVLLMLVSVFLLAGCTSVKKELMEVDYEKYNNKIESKESFVLYIGSSNCSHCASFRPKLEDVINKYELDVYYIDISKISDEEYAKLKNKVFLTGTPTVVYFKDGSYSSEKIVGDKDQDSIVNFFKKINYIGD